MDHLSYLEDLYSKSNDVQKYLQGKDVTAIQAQTILIGLFKSPLACWDFEYFSNLRQLKEDENIHVI